MVKWLIYQLVSFGVPNLACISASGVTTHGLEKLIHPGILVCKVVGLTSDELISSDATCARLMRNS